MSGNYKKGDFISWDHNSRHRYLILRVFELRQEIHYDFLALENMVTYKNHSARVYDERCSLVSSSQ